MVKTITLLKSSIIIGSFAALAVFIGFGFHLVGWAIFMGWSSYFLSDQTIKGKISVILQNGIGVVYGLLTCYLAEAMMETVGTTNAYAASMFIVVVLLVIVSGKISLLSNMVPVFLGFISYFAYVLGVFDLEKGAQLALAILIGHGIGFAVASTHTFVDRFSSKTRPHE